MIDPEKNTIIFTVIFQGEEYQVQTKKNQHQSLMSLLSDRFAIPGFGLCCGMGGCGSCAVEIDGMHTLSCDISINDELANSRIVIGESYF